MYRHAGCDCKLWNALWFYCVFWIFSYIIIDHSCLNFCISNKLSLIVYLINIYVHARCDCQLGKTSWIYYFFCEFCTNLANILIWSTISSQNIHKLCIWYKYRHLVIIKCKMWLQVMEHSLILLHFLGIFIPFCRPFMSELLYLPFQIMCLINKHILIQWKVWCKSYQ